MGLQIFFFRQNMSDFFVFLNRKIELTKILNINVATVACGKLELAMVMMKSAVLFSQDVSLHLIVFTDDKTLANLTESVISIFKII